MRSRGWPISAGGGTNGWRRCASTSRRRRGAADELTVAKRSARRCDRMGAVREDVNLVFASGFLFPQRILRQDYFRGVRAAFPGACFPRVPVTGAIDVRAHALAAAIGAFRFPDPDAPIHIIAHSMGGLDARYALNRNLAGLAARVASLSTIGTPHGGSPIADLIVGPMPGGDELRRRIYRAVRR